MHLQCAPGTPRARVLNINYEKALALPGVLAVLTAEDVPE